MDLQSVKKTLERHYSNQGYRPEDYYSNVVNADGRYLGPYIPYIGERHFDYTKLTAVAKVSRNLE